jgi:integrase/recombinase XerD
VGGLIGAAKTARDRTIIELLYFCGPRVSELVNLTWKDATACPTGECGGWLTVLGKGNKKRPLPVPEWLWQSILSLRQGSGQGLRDSAGVTGPGAVTPGASHSTGLPSGLSLRVEDSAGRIFPLCVQQVRRIVTAAARAAGITKPVSPHWLRHCFCSHSLDRGAPLHLVARDAGHANIATTGRYLHDRPKDSAASYLRQPYKNNSAKNGSAPI